jgi:predicted nucleic acid-binding protein
MRTFLDTNVFLHAAGRPHPLKEACSRVLHRVADGSLEATVDSEVLQEIVYVLARRGRRADGTLLAQHVAALFPDLLPVTRADMLETCALLDRHPRLSVRDAVHAATMLRNGITRIVSVDRAFEKIPGIHRLAPSAVG